MELSDLWLKMAKNETLTPQELDFLRIQGKNTQQNNAQTAGITNADGKMSFIAPRIENPTWKDALHSTIFDLSASLTTATESTLSVNQSQIRSDSNVYTLASASTGIKVSSMNNFLISGFVSFESNSTGYRRVFFVYRNADGTGTLVDIAAVPAINGNATFVPFSYLYDRVRIDKYDSIRLDYIEIGAYQNSGSTLSLTGQVGIMEV